MAGPDLAALEQQYNLPPGILAATQAVESGGDPSAVSSKGALGNFQLMPSTAAHLGVTNPHDPYQAAAGAAKLWHLNLVATGGDIDQAARMYQGGPDRSKWGKANAAYPGQILSALQRQQGQSIPSAPATDPNDPVEAAYSASNALPAVNSTDPVEAAYQASINPANAGNHPAPTQGNGPSSGPNAPMGVLPVGVGVGASGPAPQAPRQIPYASNPQGSPGAGGQGSGFAGTVGDFSYGLKDGWDGAYNSLMGLGLHAASALGFRNTVWDPVKKAWVDQPADQTLANWNQLNANDQADRNARLATPGGFAHGAGDLIGTGVALAPLSEIAPFEAGGEAGALARALKNYGNLTAQGAVGGAILSGGNNVGSSTIAGGLVTPIVGTALGEAAIPAAAKLAAALKRVVPAGAKTALADAVANFKSPSIGETVEQDIPGRMAPAASAPLSSADYSAGLHQILAAPNFSRQAAEDYIAANGRTATGTTGAALDWIEAHPGRGGEVSIQDTGPAGASGSAALDPADVQAAMGSRGNNVGVEGSPVLPQDVADHASTLVQQGVPLDQALREARVTSVGGSPTYATVTRDPVALQAEVEGAKLATPEGHALSAQRANNNGAVVAKMADAASSFSPTGKVPMTGEATQAAAESLAKASDTAKARVTAAYNAARAADPDALIEPTALTGILDSPEATAVPASTPEGGLLANVRNAIELGQKVNDSKVLPTGLSPDAINNIGTMANRKFGPDKAVNYWIGKISGAADQDMSQIDTLGDAWKNARQAHADWAKEFQDLAGVKKLIARDPQGNLLNANSGAANDAIWTASNSTPAVQIIKALKANGGDDALGLIKSHVAQQAYEAATGKAGNAVDQAGNSPVSGRAYHAFLNKVGDAKLAALYSPEELAGLTNLGHAANIINEVPQGVNNSSNTSSALLNAMRVAQTAGKPGKASQAVIKGLPVAGTLIGHLTGAGMESGGIAGLVGKDIVKGVSGTLQKRAEAKASNELAARLLQHMSPSAARQAANDDAVMAAKLANARNLAHALSNWVTAPGVLAEGKRLNSGDQ